MHCHFLNAIPVFGKAADNSDIWFNFGLIDKAPIFDQVIQDWDAKMSTDPSNEKFTAFEFGLNTNSNDGTMAAKLNLYIALLGMIELQQEPLLTRTVMMILYT